MARFLHLLKGDSAPLAGPVIAQNASDSGARVTVVLLDSGAAPSVPAGVEVRRLGRDGFDHSALLDLIFESDHVVSW
ncbi:MAG TPA: hypothetical protein VFN71_06380 [Methylomirabilota bacterium]|nr:hypothetical protein [Methylomirabilota bacterium]